MKCTGCLSYGQLATAYPRRPGPEAYMVEVFNSNVGEMCDEYICHACNSTENARSVIIIDSGCSAQMFSDWRVFYNFRTTTGIQVKCANGELAEASGVGDVGFLSNISLVPQLKINLISEGREETILLSGWKT